MRSRRRIRRRQPGGKTYEWLNRSRRRPASEQDGALVDERSLARQRRQELAAMAAKWAPYLRNLPRVADGSPQTEKNAGSQLP